MAQKIHGMCYFAVSMRHKFQSSFPQDQWSEPCHHLSEGRNLCKVSNLPFTTIHSLSPCSPVCHNFYEVTKVVLLCAKWLPKESRLLVLTIKMGKLWFLPKNQYAGCIQGGMWSLPASIFWRNLPCILYKNNKGNL